MRHLRSLLLAAIAALTLPAGASAVTIDFNEPAAVVFQPANTIYATNPGLTFADPFPHPPGSQIGNGSSCGVTVAAPVAGHGKSGLLGGCGGTAEFPNPQRLLGTFKPTTRTNLSMLVGHFGSTPHKMRLSLYDEGGKLINQSAPFNTTGAGVTVSVTTGSPNVMYFLLDSLDDNVITESSVWIDTLVFDDPPVLGKAGFDVTPTGGAASVSLVQGASAKSVDVTLTRVNGSAGQVNVAFANLPAGVTAKQGTSVNGFSVQFTADPAAPLRGSTNGDATVTVIPKDGATGTVTHAFQVAITVTPAMTISIIGGAKLPTCSTNTVSFGIAPHAGPADVSVSGLPNDVTATLDGQPITSTTTINGSGTRELGFIQKGPISGPLRVTLSLLGQWYTSSYTKVTSKYKAESSIDIGQASAFDISATAVQTARDLGPGSTIELRGDDLCTTANAAIQFGNEAAQVPVRSTASRLIKLEVPRNATDGPITVIPDLAHPTASFKSSQNITVDSYRNTSGFAFHNYKPNLTFGQMTKAFGYDETHYSPNICSGFTFGLVDCKVSTPLPDPWALAVLAIANATMGGGSGGACFGFSKTSEQLRTFQRPLKGLGNDGAANAFGLGGQGGPGGPGGAMFGTPGGIQEAINANQLTQLSSQYLDHYATQAVGNVLSQNYRSLRTEIEGYIRRGDHPLLSLRDGGSFDKLHVVLAYDVEPDEEGFGGYYIDVFDSNYPFAQPGYSKGAKWDETTADGGQHDFALKQSRIHVRTDGSWSLPSSNYGASTLANIIVSGKDLPGNDPTLIGGKQALKNGLTILLGWTAAGLLDESSTGEPAPSHVAQVEAGGRKLFSAPGVLNTDPKTALRGAPWAPASGQDSADGLLLAAGPGAEYTVTLDGDKTAAQSRTVIANDMVAQVNTDAQQGVSDQLHVSPHDDQIGFEPGGKGTSPLNISMMVRSSDGSTRTAEVDTKTPAGGSDAVAWSGGGIEIQHEGPATNVDLALSVTGKDSLPQTVTTSVPVTKDATTTVTSSSWKDLGRSRLTATSKGKTRKLKSRKKAGQGVRITAVKITGKVAHASISVPTTVPDDRGTVLFAVRRGKQTIGTTTLGAGGPGQRTIDWTLPAQAKKGDKLVALATTVLQDGNTFSSTASSRQTKLR